jgi:hypothetical protein
LIEALETVAKSDAEFDERVYDRLVKSYLPDIIRKGEECIQKQVADRLIREWSTRTETLGGHRYELSRLCVG